MHGEVFSLYMSCYDITQQVDVDEDIKIEIFREESKNN